MKKTIIIFYSLDGNTKFIAEHLAKSLDADLLQLHPKKEISKGFMKYFRGGKQVFMKEQPELKPRTTDITKYDTIIIGTPVRAWTYAPALKTFFNTTQITHKNIALFCCHGGGKKNTLEDMESQLTGNTIIGKIDFMEPLKTGKDEAIKKTDEWIKTLHL